MPDDMLGEPAERRGVLCLLGRIHVGDCNHLAQEGGEARSRNVEGCL